MSSIHVEDGTKETKYTHGEAPDRRTSLCHSLLLGGVLGGIVSVILARWLLPIWVVNSDLLNLLFFASLAEGGLVSVWVWVALGVYGEFSHGHGNNC